MTYAEARRRRCLRLGWNAASAAVALLVASNVGFGARTARFIDRTFLCTPAGLADGLRALDVDAVPIRATERQQPFQPRSPGFIGVASGSYDPNSELVSIRARAWQRFRMIRSPQGVYASVRRCAPSRASLTLSAKGLPGPPVRWAEHATCLIRGRVLVRVRATLRPPASWHSVDASFAGARSNVIQSALAIRSDRTGRPLAYMELDPDGGTRLWLSPLCS